MSGYLSNQNASYIMIIIPEIRCGVYLQGWRFFQMNWYTKRGLLTGVYKSTELFMIQDNSEDFQVM